jgi:DNA-binding response OmpR family regulator
LAKKVLIVDDTPGGLPFLRGIITQPLFTVFEANSGRQALEIHRRESVDLIIMNAQMPGMDGEQATLAIRSDRSLRAVSILLFSDAPRAGLRERCLAIGANDFLAKPFNSAQLMTRVSLLINVATRKHTALLAHVNVEGDGPPVEPFVARIVNLSTTGLLLEADVTLTPGRTILVKFFVPGAATQVTAMATVARRADASGAVRWGARFTTLDLNTRRIIRDYVGEK